jgi:hypothetical protein
MASLRIAAALALFTFTTSAFAADYKPAAAPLMTKWGKKVTPENAWREYPRPQLVRKDWQNLNGLWDYAITAKDDPKPEKWAGQILVPYPVESALSGVGRSVTHDQTLWYRRNFTIDDKWKKKRILLHFGAVDWEATVTVNGKSFPTHRGMSDPFSFDITDALKDGENEVVVKVWDPADAGSQPRGKQQMKPEGIWYTPVTGIWQTVWLEPVEKDIHITGLRFETNHEKNQVSIQVEVFPPGANVHTQVEFFDGERVVAESKGNGTGHVVTIENPKRWSPDSPHLYQVRARATANVADTVESYFAMRSIALGKDDKGIARMMLNGKPVFQYGPLDQGWWPDGLLTPPSDEAMKYDLEVLKKLGFNMLRKHIKVEPALYYHHCDKLGLLVWQDMPSGGIPSKGHLIAPDAEDVKFTAGDGIRFSAELKSMIDHLRFFPCIVVWVPFNEGWGQHDTNNVLKWTMEYDPSRLVDGPSGWADRGFGHMKDMHNYPGPGMFPAMPDRASVLGEFGGLGLPLKGHLWQNRDNWGYRTFVSTDELRSNYQMLVRRLHPLIGKGLSAAVYTQTTDVEGEVNGLMTYDREVIKVDVAETAKWHKALAGPPPEYRELVPTSEQAGQKWRFTTAGPKAGWEKPEFDSDAWTEADGGFGTKGTPGAIVRTEWKTSDIWLRRSFELKELPSGEVLLRMHHDEDTEVHLNGVLAARLTGWSTEYIEVPLTADARKALKQGTNTIAIHCKRRREKKRLLS